MIGITPVVSPVSSALSQSVISSVGHVLVLAPTGRDAEGASILLRKVGIDCQICPSFQTLYEAIDEKSGVLLIAEEAFRDETLHQLLERLQEQPVWSDIPVIVLTRSSFSNRTLVRSPLARLSEVIGNIMFLERPLHALTLVSAVRTAMNARRRQYQSRDYLIEREKVAEELLNYQRKLEQSNRELEQFATIASHDLQAPLRKVILFADMLEKSGESTLSKESADYIVRIKKSVSRMQLLISDLLNLSRITRLGQPFCETDLSVVIENVLDDLSETCRTIDGRVDINFQKPFFVLGDAEQLRQMFQNLIENGLKFHRPNTPPIIRISAEITPNGYQITVEDNGIGFDEIYTDRIFETFQRLHGHSQYSGTGIGLSIVRKIVERHSGHIDVTSVIGQGSKFMVRLPYQPD